LAQLDARALRSETNEINFYFSARKK
jgi:hypothetical protein